MIDFRQSSTEYWDTFSVSPPFMYYGSDDGVFRMFPGTPSKCDFGMFDYDPRIRPWYVGASSGPKDVVLVLDTSGSMTNAGRMVSDI